MTNKFLHWNEYFETTYTNIFNEVKNLNGDYTEEIFYKYKELFRAAVELIKLYIHNNGLFQFDNYAILREFYYVNMLRDGDEWFKVLNLYTGINLSRNPKLHKEFVEESKKYFYIFEHLFEDFDKRLTTDE